MKRITLLLVAGLLGVASADATPANDGVTGSAADSSSTPAVGATSSPPDGPVNETSPGLLRKRVEREGIVIDVEMEKLDEEARQRAFQEGDPVRVRFRIQDTSGQPIPQLYPAAWMDLLPGEADPLHDDPKSCQDKVEAYVGGSLLALPEVDLNVYYVLAMNRDATISVVDPLFGFGGSKLLDMVTLRAPGEDWELTEDQRRLFVSMPDVDQVAVVDTADWEVVTNIDVGKRPRRLRLQPDEHYLWTTWEAEGDESSGVSVIDTRSLREVQRVTTGRGQHELVFSDDDRWAFITNRTDGTVSVIDVQNLEKTSDVKVGKTPVSASYSAIGRALYVTHPDGLVTVVDGESQKVVARLQAEAGADKIRFTPDGRLGFVINPENDVVQIIDAATARIVQTGDMEPRPVDVAFSDELAYVIHQESEIILMIPLQEVGREGQPVPVIDFPGGQHPPGRASMPSLGDMIVQAPGATAVLVANPTDKSIYFYKEGMAAPMGHFKNYGREPRAVEVVDRSLNEVEPGVYETAIKLRTPGEYDLAFFVDSPRVIHCFDFAVEDNPQLAASRKKQTVDVAIRVPTPEIRVGQPVELEVQVDDVVTGEGRAGLEDVQVLTFLAPGVWQQRQIAESLGQGKYRVTFTPPRAGVYYVFTQIESRKLAFNQSPSIILRATEDETTTEARMDSGQGGAQE